MSVAIAVNGRIVFVSRIRPVRGSTTGSVAFIVPPEVTHPGPNTLRADFVDGPPEAPRLTPVGLLLGA